MQAAVVFVGSAHAAAEKEQESGTKAFATRIGSRSFMGHIMASQTR
jgi:hypothetical protein